MKWGLPSSKGHTSSALTKMMQEISAVTLGSSLPTPSGATNSKHAMSLMVIDTCFEVGNSLEWASSKVVADQEAQRGVTVGLHKQLCLLALECSHS